jgi:nucleoside-diphosphate-sugar epimerase
MAKTVLVTGGSGFLGGWCVIELLEAGYDVRATVRDLAKESDVRSRTASQAAGGDDRLTVLAADLGSDAGWAEAVDGCDYVLHVASPFPPEQPKDPDELIVPAREGTRRVLGAALDAGAERVVVTSSVAAIGADRSGSAKLTEEDWTDPSHTGVTPYAASKTLAERAAWDLARERGAEDRLAVVNPGAIIGPVLSEDRSYSIELVERLLKGTPGSPRIGFSLVDVRDVAALEIAAMTSPAAGGKRFIAADRFLWMADVAEILRERLGEDAAKVPTRTVPDFVVKAMALFDPGIRSVRGQLGRKVEFSSDRARSELGWSPRPVEDSVADTGRSLIDVGVVPARA